ncbi:Uncharacterized protein E6C27_scaffold2911G00060 [Cucumis melo var. makuwa]|uniref:Uncharacterized protein n=1 Tax=Cucumis melo var. makuwa TaxID=1194695 RepID=A0A5A7VB26_CUCMM|nr:Uncharacterized protein E6C27_scaffold2911G00060 [Cucumis melo var. makuwa]
MEGPINNGSKSNCPKAQAEILLVRVMVEACVTVRPTGRTETKVSHSDLGVPCGRALAQQIKVVHELGLERCQTVRFLSTVDVKGKTVMSQP